MTSNLPVEPEEFFRLIQKEVGDRLALAVLEGRYAEGNTVKVDAAAEDHELR